MCVNEIAAALFSLPPFSLFLSLSLSLSVSVGAYVRDLACYVSWSFARAYDPVVITPYVNEIAAALFSLPPFSISLCLSLSM